MTLPPPFKPDTDHIHVIIETPKDSPAKYAFDPATGLFQLMKILPAGTVFPLNFGFVPGTIAQDGDPVDVLVLTEHCLAVGCLIECRVLGVIQAEQQDKGKEVQRNDRIVAIPVVSHEYETLQTIEELGSQRLEEISQFFVYLRARSGGTFRVVSYQGPQQAIDWIHEHNK